MLRKFETTRAVYAHAGLDALASVSLDELVQRNAAYTRAYYARLTRLHRPGFRRRLYEHMHPVGMEALRTAASERRGIVLVSVHLGDFDAAGAWIAETLGLTPVVTTDVVRSRLRQSFFDHARRSGGVVLRRQAETGAIDLLQDLRRGRLVLAMLDRRSPGASVPVSLLGRTVRAPAMAWVLARRADALLVPGATWSRPDGTHVLWCGEPADLTGPAADPDAQLQRLADRLGAAIACAPHQFHVPADVTQMSWQEKIVGPRAVRRATALPLDAFPITTNH